MFNPDTATAGAVAYLDYSTATLGVGSNAITAVATDTSGNDLRCTRTVVIEDKEPPAWENEVGGAEFTAELVSTACLMTAEEVSSMYQSQHNWEPKATDN